MSSSCTSCSAAGEGPRIRAAARAGLGAWIVMGAVGVAAGALNITDNYQMLAQSNAIAALIYQISALATLMFRVRDSPPPSSPSTTTVFSRRPPIVWPARRPRASNLDPARYPPRRRGGPARRHRGVPLPAAQRAVPRRGALLLPRGGGCRRRQPEPRAGADRTHPQQRQRLHPAPSGGTRGLDQDAPTAAQVSASVGWADVSTVGYDFDALLAAADSRAVEAMAEGGDRWKRT